MTSPDTSRALNGAVLEAMPCQPLSLWLLDNGNGFQEKDWGGYRGSARELGELGQCL